MWQSSLGIYRQSKIGYLKEIWQIRLEMCTYFRIDVSFNTSNQSISEYNFSNMYLLTNAGTWYHTNTNQDIYVDVRLIYLFMFTFNIIMTKCSLFMSMHELFDYAHRQHNYVDMRVDFIDMQLIYMYVDYMTMIHVHIYNSHVNTNKLT